MKKNKSIKVLIAEDDIHLLDVYRLKFENEKFEVAIGLDGEQAIKILNEFEPTVILLDILMPKKDGFQTLKELKANPKWKSIPVIITTNLSQPSDADKAKKLGADDFLVKSNTTLEDIVKKIRSYSH